MIKGPEGNTLELQRGGKEIGGTTDQQPFWGGRKKTTRSKIKVRLIGM